MTTSELAPAEAERAVARKLPPDVPRCLDCGERVTRDDPTDDDGWYHDEDANDWGDHSAHYHAVGVPCRDCDSR